MKQLQRGFSIAILLSVLALVAASVFAGYVVSRFTSARDERDVTRGRLQATALALDQFAVQSRRLPCPANPSLDAATETGEEVRNGSGCTHAQGTIPWKSIGLRRSEALDGWGRKLSYRVHFGTQGAFTTTSLTQDGGASATDCDYWRLTNNTALTTNGLCDPGHGTDPATFLGLTRLQVTDMAAAPRSDIAYVVISHGATGLGAYTVSGARLPMPKGDELDNTRDTGPFKIRAFSGAGVNFDSADHFDDLLAYRPLPELIKATGLSARNWPEPIPPNSTVFNLATLQSRPGVNLSSASDTDTNTTTIDFGPYTTFGVRGASLANISFDGAAGGSGGIGVGGSNPRMSYAEGEWIGILFDTTWRKLAVSLADFARFSQSGTLMSEQVAFVFYRDGNPVATSTRRSCRNESTGILTSLELDPGTTFNALIILPLQSSGLSGGTTITGNTDFTISELRTCTPSDTICRTVLSTPENTCPFSPDLRVSKSLVGTLTAGANSTYTLVVDNGLGETGTNGLISVVDRLPDGLSFVSATGSGWTCNASGQTVSCNTSSVVAAGMSAPTISLTVAVNAGAGSSVINEASVTGGGESSTYAGNNTASVTSTVSP